MATDNSVLYTPRSAGDEPYQCYNKPRPEPPAWAIDYGCCRHGLDPEARQHDKRCPADCCNRVSDGKAYWFNEIFKTEGARAGAEYLKETKCNQS